MNPKPQHTGLRCPACRQPVAIIENRLPHTLSGVRAPLVSRRTWNAEALTRRSWNQDETKGREALRRLPRHRQVTSRLDPSCLAAF